MTELKINREIFLTKIKQLFEPEISSYTCYPVEAKDFKTAVYMTFLLSLKDFREKELYDSNNSNGWYIDLLNQILNSDVAKITDKEKNDISKMLNEKLAIKLLIANRMINVVKNIKRPKNERNLFRYIDDIFEFPKLIEDTYIKNRLLGLENRTIDEYLKSLNLNEIIENINNLKKGNRLNKTELIIFDIFSNIRYITYSSEIEAFLMRKIPRYAKYMAMKFIE